jgi:hypothetical protein
MLSGDCRRTPLSLSQSAIPAAGNPARLENLQALAERPIALLAWVRSLA